MRQNRHQRSDGHKRGDSTSIRNPKNQHSKEAQNTDDNRFGKLAADKICEGLIGQRGNPKKPLRRLLRKDYLNEFFKCAATVSFFASR